MRQYGYRSVNALIHFLEFFDERTDLCCVVSNGSICFCGRHIACRGSTLVGGGETEREPDNSGSPKHGNPTIAKNAAIFDRKHGVIISQRG